DENIEQGQRPRELGKPHFVENANQIPLAVVHSTVAEQHGKRRCAHVRFSKALGKYFMASTRGLWATMPKPQMLPSSISQPTSLACFSAPGSPVSRYLPTWLCRYLVPMRQGAHWPHDSTSKNSSCHCAALAMSTVSFSTTTPALPSMLPSLA